MLIVNCTIARNYYVAPSGNNQNRGTIKSPFKSIMKAQEMVEPGDTVWLRGGIFHIKPTEISKMEKIYAIVFDLHKSGKEGKRICYFAYNNEKPIFELNEVRPAHYRVMVFDVTASWIHLKGIQVVGTQVTIKTHTQSECFHNEGNHNIYELLSMHDGMAIGFYLTKGSDNLILNCDAYRNWDNYSENGKGGNTDGFGCHPRLGGKGNVFRACRAWFNSDDGFDCIHAYESVTFDHCWAFFNGFNTSFVSEGDGNGFKAGGWGKTAADDLPKSIPHHLIEFCVAVGNKANGFYSNHQLGGSFWYNNTAYENGTNFNMLNRLLDNKTDVAGYDHVLKNNLSYKPRTYETQHIDSSKCDISFNSFTLPIKITKKDFISTDTSLLEAKRNPDGSLPNTGFLKPTPTASFIDKGINIGFPFSGKAPDLGAFN